MDGKEGEREMERPREEEKEQKLKERKVSWAKLRRVDSLNLEAGRVSATHSHSSTVTPLTLLNFSLS